MTEFKINDLYLNSGSFKTAIDDLVAEEYIEYETINGQNHYKITRKGEKLVEYYLPG